MISVSLLRFLLEDERRAGQIREKVVGREGSYTERPRGEGESCRDEVCHLIIYIFGYFLLTVLQVKDDWS
jgi:hypothetical protein